MSFREYLWAVDEERLAAYIAAKDAVRINEFQERYKECLKQYYVVGGMPEAVLRFAESRRFEEARNVQLSILHQYEGDFGKHIPATEIARVRMVWNAIPMQLAKENKKFFFGGIKKGARSKDYETAIQWLVDAGLITRIHKVAKPATPLKSYLDQSSFKLFLVDVGLLGALSELDAHSILYGNQAFTEFKGALTEQYVLQQLQSEFGMKPSYWISKSGQAEVDFIVEYHSGIIPIEAKAEKNLQAKSLKTYCAKHHPEEAIRTSMSHYYRQEIACPAVTGSKTTHYTLIDLPLYAVSQLVPEIEAMESL